MTQVLSREIFVSYSHHDSAWRERLFESFLRTPLGDCRIWSDASIRAGANWRDEIDGKLETCGVAVLLVSPNFLRSTFIRQRELPRLVERGRRGELHIVWLPIAVTREQLEREGVLAEIQGAVPFELALPKRASDCPAEHLDRVRRHVGEVLVSAVDPLGAQLARKLRPRYRVGRRLAEGNIATVYAAEDPVLERDVAIKVVRERAQRQAFVEDVRDAIRSSEAPNFVNIYDAGDDEPAHCVQQLIAGQTLAPTIAEYPAGLPLKVLRTVFTRLAAALARAHAMQLPHGNLKPSNVVVDKDLEPFILPVGRRRDRARDNRRLDALFARRAEALAANRPLVDADAEDLAYLCPDRFGDAFERSNAYQADQYMLGLLAWHMATGQLPRALARPEQLHELGFAAFDDLPPIAAMRGLCPQRLSDTVLRMTRRLPDERYASLKQVLAEADLQVDLGLVMARDSWRRCTAQTDFAKRFFPAFYAAFQAACPEAAPFFERLNREQDWDRQYRLLDEAVLLLFAYHLQHDGHAEPNLLSRVAQSHKGIPARLYKPFVDALVRAVCGDDGAPPFDPQCRDAAPRAWLQKYWRDALGPGLAYLEQRAQWA